jgi:hypothetical protein
MFEQRILCHKLPKPFNRIQVDIEQEQCVNKRHKIIQESKRRMLNLKLEEYENKIQYYEQLYRQDLATLELQISNPTSSDQKCQVQILVHFLKQYLNHHTDRFLRQIRYEESCLHAKLVRHYRRQSSSSSTTKKTIDVYPQIIVDVPKVALNRIQLDYLSRNGEFKIFLHNHLDCYILLLTICFLFMKDPIISDQIKVTFIPIHIDKNK